MWKDYNGLVFTESQSRKRQVIGPEKQPEVRARKGTKWRSQGSARVSTWVVSRWRCPAKTNILINSVWAIVLGVVFGSFR